MLKKGDFIEIEYTGKLKEDGLVFDTTDEKLAKEIGMYNQNMSFGPAVICLGQGQLIRGLDGKIEGKEPGKYTIELTPDEAFGKKDAKLLRMIPISAFKKQNMQPVPGLQINVDGAYGTVKTVTGGRTIVDFNHPLSGKDVVYEIDIKRVITDEKEKIRSFLKLAMSQDVEVSMKEGAAEVTLGQDLPKEIQDLFSKKLAELTNTKKFTFKKRKEAEK